MIVTKNLAVSTIEVDLDGGTIWVNGPHCKLRISDLTIINPIEDFSMIDINEGKATMSPTHFIDESEVSEEIAEFLIFATNFIHSHLKNNRNIENKRIFLSDVRDAITTCINTKYRKVNENDNQSNNGD